MSMLPPARLKRTPLFFRPCAHGIFVLFSSDKVELIFKGVDETTFGEAILRCVIATGQKSKKTSSKLLS
jgi:hypothetical protein